MSTRCHLLLAFSLLKWQNDGGGGVFAILNWRLPVEPKPGREWDVATVESEQAGDLRRVRFGLKDLGGCGLCIITPGIRKDEGSQQPCPPAVLKQNENCTKGLDPPPHTFHFLFSSSTPAHFKENVIFKGLSFNEIAWNTLRLSLPCLNFLPTN